MNPTLRRRKRLHPGLPFAPLLLLLFLSPHPARGTVVLRVNLHQLVGRSETIFSGRVVRTESKWTEDRRQIVTDATLVVEESLLGCRRGDRITVRTLGGKVDGLGMWVSGSPSFTVGEMALLFLERRGGHRFTVGMSQGIYRILRDRGGRSTVERRLEGLSLATPASGGYALETPGVAAADAQLLVPFLDRVKGSIAICARDRHACEIDWPTRGGRTRR
jgi:hypothetical protein